MKDAKMPKTYKEAIRRGYRFTGKKHSVTVPGLYGHLGGYTMIEHCLLKKNNSLIAVPFVTNIRPGVPSRPRTGERFN